MTRSDTSVAAGFLKTNYGLLVTAEHFVAHCKYNIKTYKTRNDNYNNNNVLEYDRYTTPSVTLQNKYTHRSAVYLIYYIIK